MNFVDRIEETARLRDALSREKSSLVVVYGRRRLGKSTLIKRVLSDGDVYFLADRSEGQHQRTLLAKVVAQVFPDFDKLTYPDWESLFRAVNYRTDKRFTLCLDEFPYLVEQSPELPSVLQKLVDEKQLKYNLVLCGSSQNMMYGLFLDSTAPLYGRADEIMRLTPIRLPYIQEALDLDAVSSVEEYAVWGGVPRYWELRENRNSLSDALWHNILSINGTLYEEPIKLFQDDVKDIVKTSTIMSYIGSGANRLSEIAARCNEPATNLSRPLKKLIDLGFLEKDVPFGIDEKNAKKSLYKIADPFMAFYYQFVVPNRSFIELGRRLPLEQALAAHFPEYVSMHWEKLCRDAVTGNMVNGIVYGKAKRWWGPVLNEDKKPEQIEIDVMAESLDKKYLLVGECKWTNHENGKQLTAELLRKANLLPFAKNYKILPVLFLKNAPKDDVGNAMFPENIVELMK
ncbi:ATP-binding protein [Parabacteroides distasonis]|jgi:AAA+ ATPase superfamily predicted ATPase|uniref:ATP-binding protein n=2 Tax=Bacteroidales TaxID=171549 RepID=A0AB35JI84_PARDI|nr:MULTISPECIES: ATP-binding protein [Bacteroidales]MCS3026672.1 ATP-binding protein [Bacteroides xylanisolvens]KAA0094251.1 ATP-binding protein [Bacteroides thetaiotaomicron]KAA0106242.1 ATP-binding protein [Bacteroides thetaiotaomicron]MCS2440368.1 ATP-binding protein [Bacteroides uniformis]MDB9007185.1 ATP-binding protein [Parabacteroides distasonis]